MMKKPARYIITGVDATGVSTPVLARVNWVEVYYSTGVE